MRDNPRTTWKELLLPISHPNRRTLMKAAIGVGTALSLPSGVLAETPQSVLDSYTPEYFTAQEWAFVCAACARLIPSEGEGPGAIEAQVPIFIDKQLAGSFGNGEDWYMGGPHSANADPQLGFQSPLAPAQIYRQAIAAIDSWCQEKKDRQFSKLEPSVQNEILTQLQKGKIVEQPELRDFFAFLLQNAKEGFFADPMYGGNYKLVGWKHIGFPGARGAFREWANDKGERYRLGPVAISGERG